MFDQFQQYGTAFCEAIPPEFAEWCATTQRSSKSLNFEGRRSAERLNDADSYLDTTRLWPEIWIISSILVVFWWLSYFLPQKKTFQLGRESARYSLLDSVKFAWALRMPAARKGWVLLWRFVSSPWLDILVDFHPGYQDVMYVYVI